MKTLNIATTHDADGKTWWSLPDKEPEADPADDVLGLILQHFHDSNVVIHRKLPRQRHKHKREKERKSVSEVSFSGRPYHALLREVP